MSALVQTLGGMVRTSEGVRALTESDVDDILEIERLGYAWRVMGCLRCSTTKPIS